MNAFKFFEEKNNGPVLTGLIHTKSIVGVLADYIFDPGNVGRGACEHRGLFVHNASNRTKASYTMNFPGTTMAILTHQRTTRISLPVTDTGGKKELELELACCSNA